MGIATLTPATIWPSPDYITLVTLYKNHHIQTTNLGQTVLCSCKLVYTVLKLAVWLDVGKEHSLDLNVRNVTTTVTVTGSALEGTL